MPDISRENQTALNQLRFVWADYYTVRFDGENWTALRHNARPFSKPLKATSPAVLRELMSNDFAARQATRRRRG